MDSSIYTYQHEPIVIQIFPQPLLLDHVAIWPANATPLTHLAAEMVVYCTQARQERLGGGGRGKVLTWGI